MMDRRTIYVIAACFLVFIGWNKYLTSKYPNYGKPAVTSESKTETTGPSLPENKKPNQATELAGSSNQDQKNTVLTKPEKETRFESDKLSFTISSRGMGLKDIALNSYTDNDKNKIKLGLSDQAHIFEVRLGAASTPIDFDIQSTAEGVFTGKATQGGATFLREIKFDKTNYSFTSKLTVNNPTEEILRGLKVLMPEKITTHPSTSWLFPSYEHQDFFITHAGKNESINFSAAKEDIKNEFTGASLVALGSQYFATAILDKSDILPDVVISSNVSEKTAMAELVYKPTALKESFTFEQIFYVGPKSIDTLKAVDAELPHIINFGMLGVIATPLLYVMKYFFELVGNWGIAIILLTLLVRLVVLPFNMMSFKSMKAMQKIQPLMTAVREKYKDDPIKMNQEVMALMKEHKANPLGGCLPMLLQIPVFFALYRVIGSSIELYQSPFFGWITDLSHNDKFYVFPVLMGITMFIQQKLTPTNMDPAQAKIMAFLPLIFTFFMLNLPSGLTLYMFVSALFGITQQWIMLREKA